MHPRLASCSSCDLWLQGNHFECFHQRANPNVTQLTPQPGLVGYIPIPSQTATPPPPPPIRTSFHFRPSVLIRLSHHTLPYFPDYTIRRTHRSRPCPELFAFPPAEFLHPSGASLESLDCFQPTCEEDTGLRCIL